MAVLVAMAPPLPVATRLAVLVLGVARLQHLLPEAHLLPDLQALVIREDLAILHLLTPPQVFPRAYLAIPL